MLCVTSAAGGAATARWTNAARSLWSSGEVNKRTRRSVVVEGTPTNRTSSPTTGGVLLHVAASCAQTSSVALSTVATKLSETAGADAVAALGRAALRVNSAYERG